MSLELVRESMVLHNKAGRQTTQLLIEGDIIVPDSKPDMSNVLRAEAKPAMTEERVLEDRVSFQGALHLEVLYQAKKSEHLVHSMHAVLPIEDFINMEGISPTDKVTMTVSTLHLEYKLINDRKLNIKAVLSVTAQGERENVQEFVSDIGALPSIQMQKASMISDQIVESKRDRFVVKEQVPLSAGKPNIAEPLEQSCLIADREIRAMDGKVLIKGVLRLSFLYAPQEEENLIEVMEAEVPFHGYIESREVEDMMDTHASLTLDDLEISITPDEDGEDRVLDLEATIGVFMDVSKKQEYEYIQDAYSIDTPLAIKQENISYPQNVAANHTKASVKETITIDGKYPDALQIKKVWGSVELDEVELVDDRLIAEGVIHLEVLYVAENDTMPVSVVPVEIPFRQEIEVKGARKDMQVDITAAIEEISYNMLSPREVEIRTTLGFDVFVMKEENGQIITDILTVEDGEEKFEDIASAAIYVVQKGDTLWNIAKRYHTTVEDITQLNEIENPDKIYPGQKLLILKRVGE